MRRIRSFRCALAASGQVTAAPPRSDMNSRRLIAPPRQRTGHRTDAAYSLELVRPLWVKSGHSNPHPITSSQSTSNVAGHTYIIANE
jgi:hypothetical protein